ncbi:MAG: hypothetical protein P3X22_004215 [Thermoprotei archaeon]|nr:hypothetical protein [Thermoprotei archaeon]
MPTNEDFEKPEIVIARSIYSLPDLLDIFRELFRERIDGDAAREASLELGGCQNAILHDIGPGSPISPLGAP